MSNHGIVPSAVLFLTTAVLHHIIRHFREKNNDDNDSEMEESSVPWRLSKSSQIALSVLTTMDESDTETSEEEADEGNKINRKSTIRQLVNSRFLPKRVFLVRHGQSEGNVNEKVYTTTPDSMISLTRKGWDDAKYAGELLRNELIPLGESVYFIVSPYVRTMETFHGILHSFSDPAEFMDESDMDRRKELWYKKLKEKGVRWHEDPRIREQDFGNYQDSDLIKRCKKERSAFGSFYYRFPSGEAGSDVFGRVSTFLDSLWRNFESKNYDNYVLVMHGISIRIFLARYFRYTYEEFSMLANPSNCEVVVLEHNGRGRLLLNGRYHLEDNVLDEEGEVKRDYKYSTRLLHVPEEHKITRTIRLTPDE